jgi:ATP-dependent exoDNAse (exonuclease V) beta subunit
MSFTVYKSSAGSGKTFTLVKEYLTLVLSDPENFRKILAITFTNKAASEMKERIINELRFIASYPFDKNSKSYKSLLPMLLEETRLDEKEINKRGTKALSLILHNYSDFAIGTIDSFTHRILRSFSFDMKIPMNFEVEMDVEKLLSDAVSILISRAGSDEKLTKVLVEFTESRTDEEKNWNIENDILELARLITKEDTQQFLDKLGTTDIPQFLSIRNKLFQISRKYTDAIEKMAQEGNNLFLSLNINDEIFYYGSKGIANFFRKILAYPDVKIIVNSYVQKTIEEDKWTSSKATLSDSAAIDQVKEKIASCVKNIETYATQHFAAFKLYKMIYRNIYPVAVLNEIQKIIEDIKKEEGILPISEFNKKISGIVLSQPVPFIYERIGERYRNYMIDEFQDTSALQWSNLLPLIENSLSTGNFNMIVGDGKQAIYRWRNGDVEQFAALPELTKSMSDELSIERAESIKRNYVEKYLSKNFRSLPGIIRFNNDFFNFLRTTLPEDLQTIFENCSQEFDDTKSGGFVSIDLIGKDELDEQTYDEVTFEKIDQIISESISRDYLPGDIAILCRSNKNADKIAQHLISKGTEITTDESLLLNDSPEIKLLVALFRHLYNDNNDIAMLEILNYIAIQKKSLKVILQDLISQFNKNKTQGSSFANLLKNLGYNVNPAFLKSFPIYELAENILDIFNIDKIRNPFILFFLDAVKEFTTKKGSSIAGFLSWWDANNHKLSVVVPENKKAVRIMTIHKSKGLEFPVIVFPYATGFVKPSENYAWVENGFEEIAELPVALINNTKELLDTVHTELYTTEMHKSFLDTVNLIYVAFTRASECLYVISKLKPDKNETISIPGLIYAYIDNNGHFEQDKSVYTFGESLLKAEKKKEKTSETVSDPGKYNHTTSNNKLYLRQRASESWTPENLAGSTSWGNIAHYVLSKIKTSEDIDSIIEKLLAGNLITNDDALKIKERIPAMLSNPEIAEYYRNDTVFKSEAEIILSNGHSFRPDRVVFQNSKAIIIDYKTGKKSSKHISQVNEYAQTLEEMGYQVSEKYLLYIDENFVLKV